ncbi:MAG: DUF5615 family PIN-like protein [Bacteroidota bacterium]
MKIVIDESVSLSVVQFLRSINHEVLAIMEEPTAGISDRDVFELAKNEQSMLITRDHHFTNNLRFPPDETEFILYIRKGNLTSEEEKELIRWFFKSYNFNDLKGRLITLSTDRVKIR